MALEWYLYSQLDTGDDVSRFLDQILSGMKSVAFAGVLSAVAAKSRDLFAGQLSFLLFEPFFHC